MIDTLGAKCTGCEACVSVCPKGCISMQMDYNGFMYPSINYETCINCGSCDRICPSINRNECNTPLETFVGYNQNEQLRKQSSSGGIFALLAERTIAAKGVVFGAKLEKDLLSVTTDYCENTNDLMPFLESKYVQSRINQSYEKAKRFLNDGREVLFTGTPCQISALKRFLGKDFSNLTTVDVVCHGVPSPGIWEKYVRSWKNALSHSLTTSLSRQQQEILQDCTLEKVSFRSKDQGWKNYGLAHFVSKNNSTQKIVLLDQRYDNPFMKSFLYDLTLRDSCYDCPVKSFRSQSDITLGDAWCIGKYHPEWDDDGGTSVIFANTEKGKKAIKSLTSIKITAIDKNLIYRHNPAIHTSPKRPSRKRNKFFNEIKKGKPILYAIDKCLPPPTYLDKIIWSINNRLKHISKRIKEL